MKTIDKKIALFFLLVILIIPATKIDFDALMTWRQIGGEEYLRQAIGFNWLLLIIKVAIIILIIMLVDREEN